MLLFSRCALFLLTWRRSPCSPTCCKNKQRSIHWRIMISTNVQNISFALPLTSSWWRWAWLTILFLSASSLHNVTSTDKFKNHTTVVIIISWNYPSMNWVWSKMKSVPRIQAFQRSSALRWVTLTAKSPAACKRSSPLRLRCSALLHFLQHIANRRRWRARCATATN